MLRHSGNEKRKIWSPSVTSADKKWAGDLNKTKQAPNKESLPFECYSLLKQF